MMNMTLQLAGTGVNATRPATIEYRRRLVKSLAARLKRCEQQLDETIQTLAGQHAELELIANKLSADRRATLLLCTRITRLINKSVQHAVQRVVAEYPCAAPPGRIEQQARRTVAALQNTISWLRKDCKDESVDEIELREPLLELVELPGESDPAFVTNEQKLQLSEFIERIERKRLVQLRVSQLRRLREALADKIQILSKLLRAVDRD